MCTLRSIFICISMRWNGRTVQQILIAFSEMDCLFTSLLMLVFIQPIRGFLMSPLVPLHCLKWASHLHYGIFDNACNNCTGDCALSVNEACNEHVMFRHVSVFNFIQFNLSIWFVWIFRTNREIEFGIC